MMKRFRYMLANLISGGDFFFVTMQFKKRHETWQRMNDTNARALELIERMEGVIKDREAALHQIIACDTPHSNGTVKRMVRIAREGLE
jgi:hypothetical protein